MTGFGSLLGFVLVFFLLTWGASGLALLALHAGRKWARQQGCQVERALCGIGLVGPPLFGLTVTLTLLGHSLQTRWHPQDDHCLQHLHHAHLCLWHGEVWTQKTWAMAWVTSMAVLWFVKGLLSAVSITRSLKKLNMLASLPTSPGDTGLPLVRVSSRIPFCMVAGFRRPQIFLSTQAEALLGPCERAAVLSHESAHIQQGDIWKRLLLRICAQCGVPGVSHRILAQWDSATERLCDQRAALAIGDAAVVASALVKLVRAGNLAVAGAAAFGSAARVEERVHALLDGQCIGVSETQRLFHSTWCLGAVGMCLLLVCSDSVHHLLETLLGMV